MEVNEDNESAANFSRFAFLYTRIHSQSSTILFDGKPRASDNLLFFICLKLGPQNCIALSLVTWKDEVIGDVCSWEAPVSLTSVNFIVGCLKDF